MNEIATESVPCTLCGQDDHALLFYGSDRLHDLGGKFGVLQCLECSMVFLSPRPVESDISHFYPDNYAAFSRKSRGVLATLRQIMLKREAASLRKFLPPGARVLEVGCAAGDFLLALRAATGSSVHGVEINELAAEKARQLHGLSVYSGTIFEVPHQENELHAIVMRHVIEHFHDPARVLRKCRRLLKAGGVLQLSTPNFDSLSRRVFNENWYDYDIPRHLTVFSVETLRKQLMKEGFEIVEITHSAVPNAWIYSTRYAWEANHDPNFLSRALSIKNPLALALFAPFSLFQKFTKQSDRIRITALLA